MLSDSGIPERDIRYIYIYVFQEMIYFNALIRFPRSGTPDKIIMSYRSGSIYSTINFHMFLLIL